MSSKRKKRETYSDEGMSDEKIITVRAVVTGQSAVKQLTSSIAKLPNKKKISVDAVGTIDSKSLERAKTSLKQISSGAVQVTKDLGKINTVAIHTGDAVSKINSAGEFKTIRQGLSGISAGCSKAVGSVKNLWNSFLAGDGAVSVITMGLQSLAKITMELFGNLDKPMKEAAELVQSNTKNILEAAAANEEIRKETDTYMTRLSELAAQEKLSNVNKLEARKLIDELGKSYGDLGIRLDATTGKLVGVDEATATKLQKDRDARIRELESEIKQLMADRDAQAKIREEAGTSFFGVPLGGEADTKEAGKQITEIDSQIMTARKELYKLKKFEPIKEYRERQQAERMDQEEAAGNKSMQGEHARSNGTSSENASSAIVESEGARQFVSEIEPVSQLPDREKTQSVSQPTEQTSISLSTGSASSASSPKQASVPAPTFEQVADSWLWRKPLLPPEGAEQPTSSSAMVSTAPSVSTKEGLPPAIMQSLDFSGHKEQLFAAKPEMQPSAAGSAQQLLAPGTEGGGGSGMERFGKPGGGLFDQAMRGAAGGLSLEEAMRSAQEKKGSELSGEEAGEVRKLAELSDGDSELRETPSADLSLKTNSLTARGGFASGAKAPDSEKINREIANHGKKQNELLEKVFNILDSMEK